MSRVLDCPHCGATLASIKLRYVATAHYAMTSSINVKPEGVQYTLPTPNVGHNPSTLQDVKRTYVCPECDQELTPEQHGWTISTLKNNTQVLVDERRKMEEEM